MMVTKRGEPIESKMMIAALRRTTKIVEVTEHSMRRAGAQYYTRLGVELAVVQFLGRWGTDAVLQYVAEALAEKAESASIGGVGAREMRGGSAAGVVLEHAETSKEDSVADATVRVKFGRRLVDDDKRDKKRGEQEEAEKSIAEVVSRAGVKRASIAKAAVHAVLVGEASAPVTGLVTACGWRFGLSPHEP